MDKSLVIKEALYSGAKVTLITRPRRFGKTLAMTMVQDFFDITQDSKAIFAGLDIMTTAYADQMNSYPVIFLTFKDCKGNMGSVFGCIYRILQSVAQKIDMVRSELDSYDLPKFDRMVRVLANENADERRLVNDAILFLSKMYYQHYGQKVIILIDEYDTPMISASEQGYYDDIKDFFTGLYGTALKDNPYLHFAVLTGIHRVAKENIFSGLNNLKVCTVMDNDYSEDFGLTGQETETLLSHYELELTDDVHKMYNGYHFANANIYNPWSVINYASNGKLRLYWINTSSNLLIRQLILDAEPDFKRDFEALVSSGTANVSLKLATSFFELQQIETLWGLLLNTGYITTPNDPKDEFELFIITIPNKEVKGEFKEIVAQYTVFGESRLKGLFGALVRKDIPELTKIYKQIIIEHSSFHDNRENAYHMPVLGMCIYLEGYYEVKSNIEAGHGRSDIMLLAKDKKYVNAIMEFKQGDDIEKLAGEALAQIHDK